MILQGPEVQLLKDLGQQIRLIDKKIRKIKRDRAAALSRPGSPTKDSRPATASAHIDDSTEIDPIIALEEEKGKINARYEQVNEGRGYETLIEHEIQDFMDAYYQEITRAIKDPNWIAKYFDAEAYMHVVNVGSFVGRDLIVKTLVVSH